MEYTPNNRTAHLPKFDLQEMKLTVELPTDAITITVVNDYTAPSYFSWDRQGAEALGTPAQVKELIWEALADWPIESLRYDRRRSHQGEQVFNARIDEMDGITHIIVAINF